MFNFLKNIFNIYEEMDRLKLQDNYNAKYKDSYEDQYEYDDIWDEEEYNDYIFDPKFTGKYSDKW